jgi:predicted 3-demethylubiquinone-9 3-methyltransferase (glyoxalase superfamily)
MPPIVPCLWFDRGKAQEAAAFYTSIFPDSHVEQVNRAPADNPSTSKGDVLTVSFVISGARFIALNGGPEFPLSEAVSMYVECQDQAEVDRYWEQLTAGGGETSVCGWLKDRFGLSWQIVPRRLGELLNGSDRAGAERTMAAMLEMTKLDVAALVEAYGGVPA